MGLEEVPYRASFQVEAALVYPSLEPQLVYPSQEPPSIYPSPSVV